MFFLSCNKQLDYYLENHHNKIKMRLEESSKKLDDARKKMENIDAQIAVESHVRELKKFIQDKCMDKKMYPH